MKLQIDEEFKNLIPPLQDEEYTQLEQNIIADGCRDPIVVWNDIIVDGHNRYRICGDNNIEFNTDAMEFDSREDVIEWMLYNQIGKRNAHANLMSYMRGRLYLKSKQALGKKKIIEGQNVHLKTTAQKISENTNVSDKTIQRDAKFTQAVDLLPVFRNEILSGDTVRKKQEIIEIGNFISSCKKRPYYELDISEMYNDPSKAKATAKAFVDVDEYLKTLDGIVLQEHIKTDKEKEEEDRYYVLYEVQDKDIDIKNYFISNINSFTVGEVAAARLNTLTYISHHTGLEDVWQPKLTDEDFKKHLEMMEEIKALELKKELSDKVSFGDSTVKSLYAPKGIKTVITDPPYGMNFVSNRRTATSKDKGIANDESIDIALTITKKVFLNLFNKMGEDSSLFCFIGWREEPAFRDLISDCGFTIKNSIIWVKNNHGTGDLEGSFAPKHERIIFATKGSPKLNKRFPDVIEGSDTRTEHPTAKPVDLIKKLIEATTKKGDIVADPFAGHGSTIIASLEMERDIWGCELDEYNHSCIVEHINEC